MAEDIGTESINIFDISTRTGIKQGGVKKGDEVGGIHNGVFNKTAKVAALIKKDKEVEANISEFLGAAIFQATAPAYGARVFLTVPTDKTNGLPSPTGNEVYVGSELVQSSDDMFKDMRKHMLPGTGFSKSSILDAGDGRPRFAGTRGGAKIYVAAFEQRGYTGFNETMPTSLLLNDMDVHSGNFRTQYLDEKQQPLNLTADQLKDDFKKPLKDRVVKEIRLVRMDFGGGLKSLEPDIHPNSTSRHLPVKGPTNHFVEYPDSLKLNHEFADHLLSTASVKLDSQIDQSFAGLTKYYQPIVLAKWAHHAMPDKFDGKHLENVTVEQIQDAFKDRMKARQVSLEEYGLQIKLGLLIEQDKSKGRFSHPYKFQDDTAKQEFQKLVAEYPKYFERIEANPKELKFRDKALGEAAKDFIQEQLKETRKVAASLTLDDPASIVPQETASLAQKQKAPTIKTETSISVEAQVAAIRQHLGSKVTEIPKARENSRVRPQATAGNISFAKKIAKEAQEKALTRMQRTNKTLSQIDR